MGRSKKNLSVHESVTVASMLFGMFFGAGNLIFPAYMGQMAGKNVWPAICGFLVTGVGLPLLGVAALGVSRSDGLAQLSGKVGKNYGIFFTCALYLTIGPFFAIPRCATVPFSVGISPLIADGSGERMLLAVFTLVFFAVVLGFSLYPSGILTWIGRILNPVFLAVMGILVVTALLNPLGEIGAIEPEIPYGAAPFFRGFLEGYNTMDALAGLAFGIVVVNVIRGLGVDDPEAVAGNTVKAGIFSCLAMGVIYVAVAVAGCQSRGLYPAASNGGEALSVIARHYFGMAGSVILAFIVVLACLKTAIGLITSCAETFTALFPGGPGYRMWAVSFCLVSFLIANLGLNAILACSLPVLYFLYPLAITLILLSLLGRFFGGAQIVYRTVTGFTLVASLIDFFGALPQGAREVLHVQGMIDLAARILPFFDLGLGWVSMAAAGAVVGLVLRKK